MSKKETKPLPMYESTMQTVQSFRALMRELAQAINYFQSEMDLCHNAILDVQHFLELNPKPSAAKRKQIARIVNEYAKRRREAKDNLLVLTPLLEWNRASAPALKALELRFADMSKEYRYITKDRHYTPKVVPELFQEA